MIQIFIPELDEAVAERLKARARRHGRSLEEEARAILQEAAGAAPLAFGEAGAGPLGAPEEQGFGDLMYERFKHIGLTEDEFRRFSGGIEEANSLWEMGLPDFEEDEYEEDPSK